MTAAEAAAKTAVPYAIGAGLLALGGWYLYNELIPDAAKAVKEQLEESNAAVTESRNDVYNDYFASGGKLTVLPEIQAQDRFWTTQPKDGYEDFGQFLDVNFGVAQLPINLVQIADNALDIGLLEAAAQDGAEFRIALEERGDVERLEDLNSVERALVLSGQAISGIVGVPIYEADTDVGGCPIGSYRPLFADECIQKSGDTSADLTTWLSGGLW